MCIHINGLPTVARTRLDEEHYKCERVPVFLPDVWSGGHPGWICGGVRCVCDSVVEGPHGMGSPHPQRPGVRDPRDQRPVPVHSLLPFYSLQVSKQCHGEPRLGSLWFTRIYLCPIPGCICGTSRTETSFDCSVYPSLPVPRLRIRMSVHAAGAAFPWTECDDHGPHIEHSRNTHHSEQP